MVAPLILAVTGGTGFVGRRLLDLATERSHTVRALTRRPQEERDGVEWIDGSLEDRDALERLVQGSDAVIHVAGVINAPDAAGFEAELIGYDEVELQPEALKSLNKARKEAQKEGLDITPRDGAEAARRGYEDSVRLWNSRFEPALDYWLSQGRLTEEQVTRLRGLPLSQQVAEVLELEKTGIYFSKDLSKSILYSIAAPGASQHIAMLAFDVNEFDNPRVREIMGKHGWFQTVLSDLPHFTYLGLKEKDLPKNGLRSLEINGQVFWIPNVPGVHPGLDK